MNSKEVRMIACTNVSQLLGNALPPERLLDNYTNDEDTRDPTINTNTIAMRILQRMRSDEWVIVPTHHTLRPTPKVNRLLAAIAWRYLNESMWAWAAERDADMATSPGDAHEHGERLTHHANRAVMLSRIIEHGNEHNTLVRINDLLADLNREGHGAYTRVLDEMRRLKALAEAPPF